MIKVICDGCGKVLPDDHKNCVNIIFAHYQLEPGRLKHTKDDEINFCLDCAEKTQGFIADMLTKHREIQKLIEGKDGNQG